MSNKTKVALVVGHSEKSPGSVNPTTGFTEFEWNKNMANAVANRIMADYENIEPIIVFRDVPYRQLPEKINMIDPDFIISFHCNAFNTKTSGCETLYYYKSSRSAVLAEIVQKRVNSVLGNKNRGIKGRSTEDRGGYLLRYTNAPAVITEPFFIDNDEEYQNALNKLDDLITAYCEAINEYATIKFSNNV